MIVFEPARKAVKRNSAEAAAPPAVPNLEEAYAIAVMSIRAHGTADMKMTVSHTKVVITVTSASMMNSAAILPLLIFFTSLPFVPLLDISGHNHIILKGLIFQSRKIIRPGINKSPVPVSFPEQGPYIYCFYALKSPPDMYFLSGE